MQNNMQGTNPRVPKIGLPPMKGSY